MRAGTTGFGKARFDFVVPAGQHAQEIHPSRRARRFLPAAGAAARRGR